MTKTKKNKSKINLIRDTFQWNGLKLSFLYHKNQGKKAIFLFHANGYASGCYRKYLDGLSKNHSVFGLDFSGHGNSETTFHYDTWYFYRNQIIDFVKFIGEKEPIGIGHSMGGASLLLASAKNPEIFSKLIVFDPVLLNIWKITYVKLFGSPLAKTAEKRRKEFSSIELVRRAFKQHPSFQNWDAEIFQDYLDSCFLTQENHKVRLACDPKTETKNFRTGSFRTIMDVGRVGCETHFILPPTSDVCSQSRAKKTTRNNPSSTVEVIEGSSHFFPFESPDQVMNIILQKLSI